MDHAHSPGGFHGPKCWFLSLLAGLLLGALVGFISPAGFAPGVESAAAPNVAIVERHEDGTTTRLGVPDPIEPVTGASGQKSDKHPHIPLWLCIPFALLLGSIALMPFVSMPFWHRHYPDFAFLLAGVTVGYYFAAFGTYSTHVFLHVAEEYLGFIALVGGLYVASGGILIDVKGKGRPIANTLLLGFGAVVANFIGTTGASVLLIRPFMNLNRDRIQPLHIVFFIFIVSNCGGLLTPIGDPPLYLGYLKGVPFFWTALHLWPMWLLVIGTLLAIFFVTDLLLERRAAATAVSGEPPPPFSVRIEGAVGIVCLTLIVAGVFIGPLLKSLGIDALWVGAIFQLAVAAIAYRFAPGRIHAANVFTFEPVKEVSLLFLGIFATMAPALAYLQANGASLGLESASQIYFATGTLSAVLDNAPTYLSFLQVAFAQVGFELTPDSVRRFVQSTYTISNLATGKTTTINGGHTLAAISSAAVFFGAMTYIGNGPNFMVKAIAESRGIRMPSFFGYVFLAVIFLLPVLLLNWAVFVFAR